MRMNKVKFLPPKQLDDIHQSPQVVERVDRSNECGDGMKRISAASGAVNPLAVGIACEMNLVTPAVVAFGGAEGVILSAANYREGNQVENLFFSHAACCVLSPESSLVR